MVTNNGDFVASVFIIKINLLYTRITLCNYHNQSGSKTDPFMPLCSLYHSSPAMGKNVFVS